MLKAILFFILGAAVMAGGLGAYLFFNNQQGGGTTANTADADAAQQFFAERGGAVITDSVSFGPGAGGLVGNVASVDGDTVVVTSPMDNKKTTIRLAAGGKVWKQVSGQPSDIKVGEQITAIGPKDGDAIAANLVQLGASQIGAGGPVGISRPFGARAPGQNGGAGSGPDFSVQPIEGDNVQTVDGAPFSEAQLPATVSGKVTAADGTTIAVESADGTTTTVKLGADTTIQTRQQGALADLKPGDLIIASGALAGDTFEATELNVSSGQMMMIRP